MMSDLYYCTLCEEMVEISQMTMVSDRPGGRGRANVAVYRDDRTGTVHTVLSAKVSAKFFKKPKVEPVAPPPVIAPAESTVAEFTTQAQQAATQEPEVVVEAWSPGPDEWFAARICRVNVGYSFGVLSNGEEVYISSEKVIEREKGHKCLQLEDEVAVTLKPGREKGSRWVALQCQVETSRIFPDVERGRVTKWWEGNNKGLLELGCLCTRKVIIRAPVFLNEGDVVECWDLRPDRNQPGKYIAHEIQAVPEE